MSELFCKDCEFFEECIEEDWIFADDSICDNFVKKEKEE